MVVVGALLQVVLASLYGVVGTAAATTLTFVLGAARNAFFAERRLCPLNLAGAAARALPGTIGMAIALALTLQWALWIRLPLAVGVFAAVAWGAGAVTREDLRMIRKMLGRREEAAISS
jgi:peptidoglycan biosynthesis protein MviN/MurJ (putative lipid II flippase)